MKISSFRIIIAACIIASILIFYQIMIILNSEESVFEFNKNIKFAKIIDVEQNKIFNTMADIENYPNILPDNFLSIEIINKTDSIIYAREIVQEKGIQTTIFVKHTLTPFEKHSIEILDGDAKDSKITINFDKMGNKTSVISNIETHLRGSLYPLGFIPEGVIQNELDDILSKFVDYSINYE